MTDLFKINILYSTSHWLFPKIVIGILIILGAMIIFSEIIKKHKAKKIDSSKEPSKGKRFFCENYDQWKLFGGVILFILYIIAMDLLTFLPASIIFMFLFNLLFAGSKETKSLIGSATISVVTSVTIWYVFGILFNITLP